MKCRYSLQGINIGFETYEVDRLECLVVIRKIFLHASFYFPSEKMKEARDKNYGNHLINVHENSVFNSFFVFCPFLYGISK